MGALNNETTQSAAIAGSKTGMVIAPIFTLYIAFTIIIKKQRANHFGLIIIALLSGIGAIVGGSILGLIPATILTTFKNK